MSRAGSGRWRTRCGCKKGGVCVSVRKRHQGGDAASTAFRCPLPSRAACVHAWQCLCAWVNNSGGLL